MQLEGLEQLEQGRVIVFRDADVQTPPIINREAATQRWTACAMNTRDHPSGEIGYAR